MEAQALADAQAASAAEPAADAAFVSSQLERLDAALVSVAGPIERMAVRYSLLQEAYSELNKNVDLLPSQNLSTASALRTGFLLSPAARAEAEAALTQAATCTARSLPAAAPSTAAAAPSPPCIGLDGASTEGDRDLAAAFAPELARLYQAAPALPSDLMVRRAQPIPTVEAPLPGHEVAVDVTVMP